MQVLVSKVAKELKLQEFQVNNAIKLLFEEQGTIPFVARYRKEMTGSMDEVQLRDVRDRYHYLSELEEDKKKYLAVIAEKAALDPEIQKIFPELKTKILNCDNKQTLDDLYLPFRPKRRTRAQVAREKGLKPLADMILADAPKINDLQVVAAAYVTPKDKISSLEPAKVVPDIQDALAGAQDIIAELISENADLRTKVRQMSFDTGRLVASRTEKSSEPEKSESSKKDFSANKKRNQDHYENYYTYNEAVKDAVGHRIMAVRRGEVEKALSLKIEVDEEAILSELKANFVAPLKPTKCVETWLHEVVADAYKRLISSSIETDIRLELKKRAEAEAINVFSQNLANLLMLPPLPRTIVMGIDPGLRTGSKIAVISETGALLDYAIIYPNYNDAKNANNAAARDKIKELIVRHKVEYLSIGNGTGSREIDHFIKETLDHFYMKSVKRAIVNESGASVYSTDDIAREEFPTLDPTIRSAVSIARRLQDPLAELVKIDPRSIGVGQYQHDVNVNHLSQSLKEVVESCVNNVGVNLNTASYKLLSYVSGIGATLAKNIVKHREANGPFLSRQDLYQVVGFGPKAFEQASGFLRVPQSHNPLDNSAVHPERYHLVETIVKDQSMTIEDILTNGEVIARIPWEKYVNDVVGMPTLVDIQGELIKPGRDPREDGSRLFYSDEISELSQLRPGMKLKGTVTNVTNFGAFVDIGVHQDGLVHISELADQFVKDPATIASVGKVLEVTIVDVDVPRKRISLSCKSNPELRKAGDTGHANDQAGGTDKNRSNRQGGAGYTSSGPGGPPQNRGGSGGSDRQHAHGHQARGRDSRPPAKPFTMDDLLSKFGKGK